MSTKEEQYFAEFAAMGEPDVRIALAKGTLLAGPKTALAHEWLCSRDVERSASASAIRDAREAETLAIAKEALSVAKDANRTASEDLAVARSKAESARLSSLSAREQARWAKIAATIAAVAALVAAKEQIHELINYLLGLR